MLKSKNKNIKYNSQDIKVHGKASERYVDVSFEFKNRNNWNGWIPIEYRRAGLFLETSEEIDKHINLVYDYMKNNSHDEWLKEQKVYWKEEKPRATVTKGFFDELAKGGWKCVTCDLPSNPNWARRTQDLKDFGYMLSTDTNKYCSKCKKNTTHLQMIPIKRFMLAGGGYETWSTKLRNRIINVLNNYDVYEGKKGNHLLPDHKFPEIRWGDDTKAENPDNMSDKEIKEKFQLLTNQRNLQKREVCRKCYQTNNRGFPFGIKFYYKGEEAWDQNISKVGKESEKGCKGCGWYDMEMWRTELIKRINVD